MLVLCSIIFATTILLIMIAIPLLITFALRSSFPLVQMKLYSPLSLRGILLNGPTSTWGLSNLTIYISAIELGLSPNKFKLRLNFQNIQIYFTRKAGSLQPVNLIDVLQQPNILYNFLNFLCGNRPITSKQKSNDQPLKSKYSNSLKFFGQGLLHLFLLMLMHTIQINLTFVKAFVVSNIPNHLIRYDNQKYRKQSLMIMQCLAQYSIKCDLIELTAVVEQHHKYKINFSSTGIVADSANHWTYHFIEIINAKLQITIPFSMSIVQSMKSLGFTIRIDTGIMNLVPEDFDIFFQLLKQLLFAPFQQTVVNVQEDEQQQNDIEIFIDKIQVNLRDIFEAQFDNQEAKQYLTNVASAELSLQKFCLEQGNFSIDKSILYINKFYKENSYSKRMEVVKIPSFCIQRHQQQSHVEITHDQVIINCHSEEIALFGKIFTIINSRIKFQNYSQDTYKEIIAKYLPGRTLISDMEETLHLNISSVSASGQVPIKKQRTLVYNPKRLIVMLQMKRLNHVITFEGFKYIRHHNFNEMSHQVLVSRSTIQYRGLKQFAITDFTLVFSQTINQNQLSIQIKDIAMNQNEETLTDYLDCFTLFKHLLQFESDQKQKQQKLARKQISIDNISITIGNQTVSIKQLQIQKKTHINELQNKLYFSLGNCEVILLKMKNTKKLFKYHVVSTHSLFSIHTLTIKTTFQRRHGKPKQKMMVFIKDPTFTLPEVDISGRIFQYIKMYAHMKNHIEAYFINVTNQKLKSLKYLIKQLLQQPQKIQIQVTKAKIQILDNKFNTNLLAYSKAIREYFSTMPKYNQSQVINYLKRFNKSRYPLLSIEIDRISLQVGPISPLKANELSINSWIYNFEVSQFQRKRMDESNIQRFRRVKAGTFKFKSKNISVKIRDYPASILQISKITLQGEAVKTKKLFGDKKNYVNGKLQINDVAVSVGLGQLSGLQQISKRISQLSFISQASAKAELYEKNELTIWHNIFRDWRWSIEISKTSNSKIQILTGDTPYTGQKFIMSLGKFVGFTENSQTSLELFGMQLKLKQFVLIKLPKFKIEFAIALIKDQFDVQVIVKALQSSCILKISSWIIRYLQELGQLKKDWLLIYGIYQREIERHLIEIQEIQNMSYIEIANMLANRRLNSNDSHSIMNFLSKIKINCFIGSLKVALIQQQLQLALIADNIHTFTVMKPNHDLYNKLEVIRSKISSSQLTASFGKIFSEAELSDDYHQPKYHQNTDRSILNDNRRFQFMHCKQIVMNFNWFFIEGKRIGLANNWISIGKIEGQISKKVERYCSRIFRILIKSRKSKKKVEEPISIKPIDKLRASVLEVIRINRRKKIQQGRIQKYDLVLQIQSYEFSMKQDDQKLMKMKSQKKAQMLQSMDYKQNDKYHSKPFMKLLMNMPANIIEFPQLAPSTDYKQIITTGVFTIQICNFHDNNSDDDVSWGICQFDDIQIYLDQTFKDVLEKVIFFIVDLVNSTEERKRQYRIQTEKYSQLVNSTRRKLKQKIQWKQSDLKWNQRKIFHWNFIFNQLDAMVFVKGTKVISATVASCDFGMNLFCNSKIQRKIIMKKLSILNQLELQSSQYRKIMQLGRDTSGIVIVADSYEVKAFSDVVWDYFREVQFWIQPLKIKITDNLLTKILQFIGQPQPRDDEDEYDELTEYRNKTPVYYKHLIIEAMNFQMWLHSNNIIKRMDGIRIKLQKFQLKQKLYTKEQLIRAWIMWLVKQIAGQTFDVLGQKIFGEE